MKLSKATIAALPPEERADAMLSLRKQIMQVIEAMPEPKRTETLKSLEAIKQKGIKMAAMYRTQKKILSGDYPHTKKKD